MYHDNMAEKFFVYYENNVSGSYFGMFVKIQAKKRAWERMSSAIVKKSQFRWKTSCQV